MANVNFYNLDTKVIAVMHSGSEFWFSGKLKCKPLFGAVQVYGATIEAYLESPPIEIYSPQGYSSVGIRVIDSTEQYNLQQVWSYLGHEFIKSSVSSDLQRDVNSCKQGDAVLILENLENTLTRFLSAYCPLKLFPGINRDEIVDYNWKDMRGVEVTLQSKIQLNRSGKNLIFDHLEGAELMKTIKSPDSIVKNLKIAVFGGKGAGKSTSIRFMTNELLKKSKAVIIVDLDLGQPECTPSACISLNYIQKPLLGPSFTHLEHPYYSIFLGNVNVVDCIPEYLDGLLKINDALTRSPELQDLPVIINTMGFTRGLGWDFAVTAIRAFQPTHVLQLMSNSKSKSFKDLLRQEIVNNEKLHWKSHSRNFHSRCSYNFCEIKADSEKRYEPSGQWTIEPRQQRELLMISYFSKMNANQSSSYDTKHISSIYDAAPYKTPFGFIIVSTMKNVPESYTLSAINGSIVALCYVDTGTHQIVGQEWGNSHPKILLNTKSFCCYGFGIVRGVDFDRGEIFINSPLIGDTMNFVNCLVGSMPIPLSLYPVTQNETPYIGVECDLPTTRQPVRGFCRINELLGHTD